MKKSLIALASLAALGAAHADVTLYGVIDASFATISAGGTSDGNNPGNLNTLNSYAAAGAGSLAGQTGAASAYNGNSPATANNTGNGRVTSMASGLLQASRWGLKGTEDLGGGMKANFVLESALNIAAGTNPNDHLLLANNAQQFTGSGDSSLNGQMFDRQSTVGLQGDFGQIDVGYQINLNGEHNAAADPFSAGGISPLGFYGGLTGAGSSYTGRASNSIKYAYNLGNTTLKAFYAMGGVSGNAGQGSQTGLMAMIQASPSFSINLAASRMNDDVSFNSKSSGSVATAKTANVNTAAAVAAGDSISGAVPGLSASYYNSTESALSAIWQATPVLQLKAGYLTVSQSSPSNPVGDALNLQNNGIPISAIGINTNPYATTFTRTIGWVGGTYDLTPVSHLTAAYYQETLGAYTGNVVATAAIQQTYSSNTAQIFAIAYKYDLSKKTDVYVAANYESWNSPGAANGTTATSIGATNTTPINQTTSAGTSQTLFAVGLRTKF
jgi:predicted porin